MCLVLDIAAMLIKQPRQNGPGVSLKTGPLDLPSASQFAKLRSKTQRKSINITKTFLHGGGHNVSVNVSVDALELIQNNSVRMRAKCSAVIHIDAAARKRSVWSPSLLPFAVVVNAIAQGRTASFNDSDHRKE